MEGDASDSESHSLRGPIDRGALLDFRDTFEQLEPLATGELDDFLSPNELRLELDDGVGDAESARFDVVWTTRDDYTIHYTDNTDVNLRWDIHPNDYPQVPEDRHFHPPPNATSDPAAVEDSCIEVSEIVLVARAAHVLWRHSYEQGSFEDVNGHTDPP